MNLAPFGVLHDGHKRLLKGTPGQPGVFEPMADWPKGRKADFETLMRKWLQDVSSSIWPEWRDGAWIGAAANSKETTTKAELELAVRLYQGGGDGPGALAEVPQVPVPPDGRPRTHEWHYKVEDALIIDQIYAHLRLPTESYDFRASQKIGSNFLVYDPSFPIGQFEDLFWRRMRRIEPPLYDIKQHFQRPRPWMAAAALGVKGFRWVVAGGGASTHTGVHPSLLSGHCIQGILGGCSVYDALLDTDGSVDPSRTQALQKYMVDWGDRRVFAGVHYMTDNIASWTLARRLIPHLFHNPAQVEAFAVAAITRRSRVFANVVAHFDTASPARAMLLSHFPEADPTA